MGYAGGKEAQAKFADFCGLTTNAIKELEKGTYDPSWGTLVRINDATQGRVPPSLFTGVTDASPRFKELIECAERFGLENTSELFKVLNKWITQKSKA
jgi:DNA-binding XRE family transcriptional regulator